jgi:3-oxosteroid 1-dehydrogenase
MIEPELIRQYDVIVVGSGTSGMMAAIRAHDLGLSTIIIEKTHFFGGTSAMSGGNMWLPTNHLMETPDNRQSAMDYMKHVTGGEVSDMMLEAFLDHGPAMLRYLEEIGVPQAPIRGGPDYVGNVPGSRSGRSTVPVAMDAALLGDELGRMRMPGNIWQLFERYAMDFDDLGILGLRLAGWRRRLAKLLIRYWCDLGWRVKTRRDRKLTFGNALIGGLRLAMIKRKIPLVYNLALSSLIREKDGVTGAVFIRDGNKVTLLARQAVVLAAGGFEHDPALRAQHLPFPTSIRNSWTPEGNVGDTLKAAKAIDAGTDHMDALYNFPAMQLPVPGTPPRHAFHMVFRYPHSLCVNRLGDRFADESCSYDDFGAGMIADYQKTGRNLPCWMIFDAQFREKYACGGVMPTAVTPDRKIPSNWWDSYIYRAETIGELARKINLEPAALEATFTRFNGYAANGVDEEFNRGSTDFDKVMGGDPRMMPNPSLGALIKPPYYAVPLHLCDVGTKGGLRIDTNGAVLDIEGSRIPGLYAAGVNAAALFGRAYPGAGASIGPANAFAFAAANDIAWRHRRNASADEPASTLN